MMQNRPWLLKWLNRKVKNFYRNRSPNLSYEERPDGSDAEDRSP
jgi:hypothetical protein